MPETPAGSTIEIHQVPPRAGDWWLRLKDPAGRLLATGGPRDTYDAIHADALALQSLGEDPVPLVVDLTETPGPPAED